MKNDKIRMIMTLVVALKSKDGVVLAGDKRSSDLSTSSLHYNDNATKVFRINERVAVGGAGDGYDSKLIVDLVLADPNVKDMCFEDVLTLISNKARQKQAEWYTDYNKFLMNLGAVQKPLYGFLIVGIDSDNKPKIYSFGHTDHIPHEVFEQHCTIGITDISNYIFLEEHKTDMTLNQVQVIATKAIEGTSKISIAVSYKFDLIIIEAKK